MLRLSLILLSFSILVACKQGAPKDHLPADVMQKVLLDINTAEAYSVDIKDATHKIGIKNTDSLSVFYKTIFDHYKITSAQFDQSLEWYKAHPDDLDSGYAKMIPVAATWQTKANAIPITPKKDTASAAQATSARN